MEKKKKPPQPVKRSPHGEVVEAGDVSKETPSSSGPHPSHVEVVEGADVLKEIAQINSELGTILGRLHHAAGQRLFVANYGYGSLPVDRGVFRTPCLDSRCSDCQRLSDWIGSNWSHRSTLPLQFLLSGWAEAHLDYGSEIIPLRLLQKGDLFGAFELCDTLAGIAAEPPPWSVSSGARSVVIQASVGDHRIREALAEDLEESLATLPDPITRPWKFARLVACKKSLNWQSRVFFIPADWIFSDAEISYPLRLYVTLASWSQSAFLRLNVADDTVELGEQKLLVPYHTARHLRLIARGEAPAFRLITTDEPDDTQAGPFKALRTLIENVLSEADMKHNVLVLQPSHLRTIGASGYYSLSRPTLLGPRLPPSSRNHADSLHNVWDHFDEIHGKGRPYLDLEKTTIHTPFETSESRTHRKRAGLGLPTYLRQDLGLPAKPDPVFRLRNSKGEGSFFAACIRVVRL